MKINPVKDKIINVVSIFPSVKISNQYNTKVINKVWTSIGIETRKRTWNAVWLLIYFQLESIYFDKRQIINLLSRIV